MIMWTFGSTIDKSVSWLQVLARDWNGAGLVMLGTYGTTTTMINLYVFNFPVR